MEIKQGQRLIMPCPGCGKPRLLPENITPGVPFSLLPCGHYTCATPFHGVLRDDMTVEDLSYVPR